MPCPLIESDNYPDYIKSILKQIEIEDDEELKACACSLKTVLDEQKECVVPMTDGKLALFPFCIEDTETDPTTIYVNGGSSDYWIFPLGISLDDLMLLYWQNYEVSLTGIDSLKCPAAPINIITSTCGDINKLYAGSYGYKSAVESNIKYLVCPTTFSAHQNRTCAINEEGYGCNKCHTIAEWGGMIAFASWEFYSHPICYRYDEKYYPTLSFVSALLSSTQHDYGLKGQAKLKIKENSYDLPMYLPVEYAGCFPSLTNAEVLIEDVNS